MSSGIYCLRNIANGKRYIGRTVDFRKRKEMHFWELRNNRHFNKHLQSAYNLNPNNIVFEIIEECDKELCNEKEIYYISYFKTMDSNYGYNLCEGGKTTTGRICTEETKRKISAKKTGAKCKKEDVERRTKTRQEHFKNDPEFAAKCKEAYGKAARGKPSWNKGRPCPEEKKKYLSELFKGKPRMSEAHKKKLSRLFRGEKSITAKLKESEVVDMRLRFLKGEPRMEIAKDYPFMHPITIYDIVKGNRWKHIPNTIEELERIKYGKTIF